MSKSRVELINTILNNKEDNDLEEEELVHILLQRKLTVNTNRVQEESLTVGQKMADNIAKFAGSWTFILVFLACLVLWILVNTIFLLSNSFDPYPFILLNLILSCVAAIQAPVIMMSQNRQEEKDRIRSQSNYKTSLKSEIIVEDLHQKLDEILSNQESLAQELEKIKRHDLGGK